MSVRKVSATDWNSARGTLNNLITSCNNVNISSTTGTITPSVLLQSTQTTVSRTVTSGIAIRAAHFSDSDGIVTKYNFMRKYDSCRRRLSSGEWNYGRTAVSSDVEGRRDGSFTTAIPAYITAPVAGGKIQNIVLSPSRDILEIIVDGCAIHNTTLFPSAGTEYIVISECHSSCHSSCYSSCKRGKR